MALSRSLVRAGSLGVSRRSSLAAGSLARRLVVDHCRNVAVQIELK